MSTKTSKTLGVLALAAIAGAALTGCGSAEAAPTTLQADGTYVMAPAEGGIYTMTVAGQSIEITHGTCSADSSGPVQDPRETSFGELAQLSENGAEATSTSLSWLEPGAFAGGGEQEAAQLELLSNGQIVRVGDKNFFSADGTQGTALQEQFDADCTSAEPTSENKLIEPSEPADPYASATPTPSTIEDPFSEGALDEPATSEDIKPSTGSTTIELD